MAHAPTIQIRLPLAVNADIELLVAITQQVQREFQMPCALHHVDTVARLEVDGPLDGVANARIKQVIADLFQVWAIGGRQSLGVNPSPNPPAVPAPGGRP